MNGWFDDFDSLYEMYDNEEPTIVSIFVRNFIEKSHVNQAVFCSLSHSVFCSRSISGLM